MSRLRVHSGPLALLTALVAALAVIVLSVVFAYDGDTDPSGAGSSEVLVLTPQSGPHAKVGPLQFDCTPIPPRVLEPDISRLTITGPCTLRTTSAVKCTFGEDNAYMAFVAPIRGGGDFVVTINIADFAGPGTYDAELHASIGNRLLPVQMLWSDFTARVAIDGDQDMITFIRPAVLSAEIGTGASGTETISGHLVCSVPT